LRFPRFIRLRTDKAIEQASTAAFLAQMWQSQQGKGQGEGVDDGDLVDVDFEEDELEEDFYVG
jgi:DNA ligase-1